MNRFQQLNRYKIETLKVERDDLKLLNVPPPTETHYPVGHYYLLQEVLDRLFTMYPTIKVEEENHFISRHIHKKYKSVTDGKRYMGVYRIHIKPDVMPDNCASFMLAMKNSHDKSVSWQLLYGLHIHWCSNGQWSGEYNISRKHTKHILRDVHPKIDEVLGQIPQYIKKESTRMKQLREIKLMRQQVDHLLMESVRRNIIGPTTMKKVEDEWKRPSVPQFEAYTDTAYGLYNAYTFQLKDLHQKNPLTASPRLLHLSRMFDEKVK